MIGISDADLDVVVYRAMSHWIAHLNATLAELEQLVQADDPDAEDIRIKAMRNQIKLADRVFAELFRHERIEA